MLRRAVVVPSVNGLADLADCLNALERQRHEVELEILVIDRCGPVVREAVLRSHPMVRLIAVEPDTPIPSMRAEAFRIATGDYVADGGAG